MSMGLTRAMRDLMRIIQELQDAGHPVGLKHLAWEMDIAATSNISRLIAQLEERGYLKKPPRRRDGVFEILQRVPMADEGGA